MTSGDVRDELAHLRGDAAILFETYLARPVLRGISHLVGFFAAIGAGLALVLQAGAAVQIVASLVYGTGLALALGTSALYHRIKWRPTAYRRIRKLDHSMIYVLIASSCTPIALIATDGAWRVAVLVGIWSLAAVGIAMRWLIENQPRWMLVATYIGMGWSGIALFPALQRTSDAAFALALVAGVLYTIGGFVYLVQRPNPIPRWFGFHEVFHALVIAAATCHFLAVWPLVTGPLPSS